MDLRRKLATIFLLLLVLPFVFVSAIQIDRTMDVMVEDMADSGTLLTNQIFEQLRSALTRSPVDRVAALRNDRGLSAFIRSSQAFGRGVVYVRVETPDGRIISGDASQATAAGASAPLPFAVLKQEASSWWPLLRIRALWGERTFEMERVVKMEGQPLAVIRIGLSTALIASEARRSVEQIVAAGAVGIVLSILGAAMAGGFLLEPIAIITSGVEQMAEGRDEVKLRIEGRDELGTLAEKFNQLSHRIKLSRAQWETERGQFFDIFRSITDGVLLLDSTGAILFANAEAHERLGLPTPRLAEGKPLSMLLGSNSPLTRMVETARTAGTEVRDVALELGEQPAMKRVLISIFALGRGPEPPGSLVVVRDLESVKELESVVDYSGRLMRLGGLISGIAHQIRNPLNSMNLQLELLAQDEEHGKPITARLQTLRGEIERLDRAVGALLRFMRPERLQLGTVTLDALLAEEARHSGKPGISFEYRLDPNIDAIIADRALLGEALRNIISNAVDAMPHGGRITFSTVLLPGGFVEISIKDEGTGIAPENLHQIFNLYFTTKKLGSGLGLPLARRAVDLHHGTLDVKSQPRAGTTFIIRLPVRAQQIEKPHHQTA